MATVAIDARDAAGEHLRGWGRYARELCAGLRRTESEHGLDLRFLTGSGTEVLWEQLAFPRRARRAGAGCLHAPNCFLPLRRPCPGVVTVHDLAFEAHPDDFAPRTRMKYRTLVPRAVRSAERVICPSAFTRDDLAARYGIDPAKVTVIAEAAALPHGGAEPPPGPYLLAVGDLRRKKNLVRLAEAHRALHANGLPHRLVLAGIDAGEGDRIKAAAGRAPVELTGWVDDERLDALYRGADLLVHPSLYEGFGLVLVEAMARGVPVACANATALPETAAGAAELFDPLNPTDVARAIETALADRERLAEAGRRRAAELTWDETARRTAAVYRELL